MIHITFEGWTAWFALAGILLICFGLGIELGQRLNMNSSDKEPQS